METRQIIGNTPRVTQTDEDFNIRFVNMVKKHRCLYDKKVPEYRNRDYQEKAWSVISQETRESVVHCKERWRNLRACLSRYIKQQNGADPQHKPYYLTEHMSFLLPFLKSTRQSIDSSQNGYSMQSSLDGYKFNHAAGDVKQSFSDNDEETIDAFDSGPPISRPPDNSNISDTNSAHTLNNFIPDVQIEMRTTPDSTPEIIFPASTQSLTNGHRENQSQHCPPHPKRFRHDQSSATNDPTKLLEGYYEGSENSDMEFFRSILPDIVCLTPQQKRKFKIGILELIDEVLIKYPAESPSPRCKSHNNDQQQLCGFWKK